ncbi:MAG: SpvB/TcaC N-terminal domain-containing protein [Candidatus Omnitrophota bacterium]
MKCLKDCFSFFVLAALFVLFLSSSFFGLDNECFALPGPPRGPRGIIDTPVLSGTLIGPEGGEVVSSNGKVKLIISSGALSVPVRIEINLVDNNALEDAAPSNTSLLNAVECKPYGLVFNKSVSLVYTFDHPEIPGTTIELGLYDSAQDKIVSTGQTSVVGADGYSATFALEHFSTYAALKTSTPDGVPIGSGVKIPLPDMFTGAFSHSIPLTVVPGRKGVQPSLAITYRSSNPNSWVGIGCSLNPGYITRSTRLGPPTYIDAQDTFYLITDAGTTELVHLVDNLYQAKIESSFTKFFKESDDSWKAVAKDGSILKFGQTSEAKEGSSLGTFSWYLTKAIDTNSNYIDYYYTKDEGKAYLSRIEYTGNQDQGLSSSATVEFFLETREDITSSYLSSSRIAVTKRLKEVLVKLEGGLVWRYVLEYTYSPDTNRSLLTSVRQYASDGAALPEQKLGYQKN